VRGGSSARGDGRVRQALVKRLEKLGWIVTIGPIGAVGGNRRWRHLDDTTVCWEAHAHRKDQGETLSKHLVSYDTMTACARGCTVDVDDNTAFVYSEKLATP